jgi:hypothetical protein
LNPANAVDGYGIRSIVELMAEVFVEPKWIIPGIIPEGATLLVAKPKVGKSFMALDIALAVASGGMVLGRITNRRDVLYLSLEDGERRLQQRLAVLRSSDCLPTNLYYRTEWPTFDRGGVEQLVEWLEYNPKVGLVIFDTLAKVKSRKVAKNESAYDIDYRSVEPFKMLVEQMGVSVIVIHHSRKSPSEDDPFDVISGTTGLAGVFDTVIVLCQTSKDKVCMYTRGRDTDASDIALRRHDSGAWEYLGTSEEVGVMEIRNQVLAVMEPGEGYMLKDLCELTERKKSGLCRLVGRMVEDGCLCRRGKGVYVKP